MIILTDLINTYSNRLIESLKSCDIDCPAIAITYDGFLPDGVESPYSYYVGDNEAEGKPLYFGRIDLPCHQEIKAQGGTAIVYEQNKVRSKVYYSEPKEKRYIKIVDQIDESGKVRWSDHYNRYGRCFARTVLDSDEKRLFKYYFDRDGKEKISENIVTGHIMLKNNGRDVIFKNRTDFVIYYLKDRGFDLDRILYNSLSTPFFVSEKLGKEGENGNDVLFWQESIKDDIPLNMKSIFDNKDSRTKKIAVMYRSVFERMDKLPLDKEKFSLLGYHYDFEKENTGKKEAAVFTNSDEIENLEDIVKTLPGFVFHVAAVTEMSSKLMALDSYENVKLYPNVRNKKAEELFDNCDFLLDINRGKEILGAVEKGFLHNHLILAFDDVLHNEQLVAEELRFKAGDHTALSDALRKAAEDEAYRNRLITIQHEHAMSETKERYEAFIQ
ncbi:MAG: accessory Sec system glycosylation chaperone GtfB [Butyrivibrio sp.]|uniref:accessory Sec system glycosylation chaperone GtfB n=1 Tax=Butyrivibrio sp. TaxID=28121 RepID=UPI001B46E31E|nr:accessory Sec system glycosylation chaperone GtfB [Butyrivibrio sp.]MBP3783422.1 accessory Sec system glycosylation chaperone GtfB [Butyrivibrio sp.]MBP3814585.1 accessory Sec system glycosylation chaperone GtfB [Butyrivibrio sp.]